MAGLDVGVVVRDLGAMTDFYCEVLDVAAVVDVELPGGARVRRLQIGESFLKLYLPPADPDVEVASFARGPGLRYFTAPAPDQLEESRARALRNGAVADSEIIAVPGARVVLLTDPEGNAVELIERFGPSDS